MKYLFVIPELPNSKTNNLFSVPRESNYLPVIQKLEFFDNKGNPISTVPANSPLKVHIHYKHSEPLRDSDFGLTFESILGVNIFYVGTRVQKGRLPDLPPSGFLACHIPNLPLVPGLYFVSCGCSTHSSKLDYVERGCSLTVTETDVFGTGRLPPPKRAVVFVDAEWEVKPNGESTFN